MARLSIKQRITLFYAAVLILITLLLSTFFFFSLRLQIRNVSVKTLETSVNAAFDNVITESDWLEVGKDFNFYSDDVVLVLYGPEGTLLLGSPPSGFPQSLPLISGQYQNIRSGEEYWQVFDILKEYPNGTSLWVRGIYSMHNSMESFNGVFRTMAFVLPVILAFAILLGYLITLRAFSPIIKIQKTAEEISRSGDFSRRIALGVRNGNRNRNRNGNGNGNGYENEDENENGNEKKDELYHLSQVFDSMFDRIESAFNKEKQFTSDVSHELRTPLSVIISQAEYGLAGSLSKEEYRTCLKSILAQGEKTSRLVGSLLDISRADNAMLVLSKENLNLADLCEAVMEEMGEKAAEKNIVINGSLDKSISFNGDQTQLLRMVINLIANAVTHGRKSGFVQVTLRRSGHDILLSVSDDGIGIAPEHIERIFDRFYQVNSARSGSPDGNSGLGLAMVRMIAEAHGGSVSVQSKPGAGSTFTVTLPET
ncbi:MAG: sensor histidine kinase [Saccharofermentanales bacterium]